MGTAGSDLAAIDIRRATHDDVPAINALIGASVRALAAGLYSPQQIDASIEHVFGVDTQLVDDRTYFVAESNGVLAAAGGWSARLNTHGGDQTKLGDDPLVDPATQPARIRAFFVDPRFARRGLATRLFEKCEAEAIARGFHRLALVSTLPGVPLYLKLGFRAVSDVNLPLPGGLSLPCVHMERALT